MHAPTKTRTGHYQWTVEKFYRALDSGVFDEPWRLELIDGEIRQREAVNPAHATTVARTARRLRSLLEPAFCVREEKPVRLGIHAEPVPDVSVVVGADDDYARAHPGASETRLLIEIAESSLTYDTGDKASLYAFFAIPEYWVVDLPARRLIRHRDPSLSGYQTITQHAEGEMVTPLVAPMVPIAVADLLPRRSDG